MTPAAERLADGYAALFEPGMRGAQTACLDFGRLFRGDRWPTITDVRAFARLYHVSAAELGAFFGMVLQHVDGREVWVDTMRSPVHPYVRGAGMLTPGQEIAFGFHLLSRDALGTDIAH